MSGVAEGKGCNFTLKWHVIRGAARKQSRAGGGTASRKRAPYFTLANKQKGLTLKNSLSLLNLCD